MSHLHLGTFDADALIELLPAEHNPTRCLGVPGSPSEWRFKHGDQWEEWGEGMDPASGQPERVVVSGGSHELMADLAWIMDQSPGLLQPMTYPPQRGCIAVITADDDDSTELFFVTDTLAMRAIHALVEGGVDETEVWLSPEWRERQGAPALPASEE